MNTQPPVAIVTGASSGIGKAAATQLAQAGFRVFGTSRKPAGTVGIDGFEMLSLDVGREQSVNDLVAEVMRRAGRIDVLVNNAGIGVAGGAEESSNEQARSLFDINVFGLMSMTRAVLPHMRRQGSGRIVNISSVLGLLPAPYMALYASTKHAVEGYSESLDHEVRTQGIRVCLVEPAYTRTAFDQNAVTPDAPLAIYDAARANLDTHLKNAMVIGDDPATVAKIIVKAATDKNPKLRYTAGKLAGKLALLRRFAPWKLVDSGIRKENGLSQLQSG